MSFIHVEKEGSNPTLVLFHGTGGTENDLIPVGQDLLPGARLVSPRGKVNEHGMHRWFRRFAEGLFDEDDIRRQASDLADFLRAKKTGPMIGLGYSNGANIGASLMLLHPDVLDGLVMWRGMNPIAPKDDLNLANKKILMINGTSDPMAPTHSVGVIRSTFAVSGATLEAVDLPGGHGLTQSDFLRTKEWLTNFN